MGKKQLIYLFLIVSICVGLANAELDQEGKNVCFKDLLKNTTVQIKYTYPIEVNTFKICGRFPFTCKAKKTEYRVGIRPENRTSIIKVAQCCDGYIQVGDKCKPFCSETCMHGECNAPNTCDCQLGFGGKSCNLTCPLTKFGLSCEYDCECLTVPTCNRNYVSCSCEPGNIPPECKNICKCKSSVCNPGFIGKDCKTECPAGTFGTMCIGKCNCKNSAECTKDTGNCLCKPGYYGIYCEYFCNNGQVVCDKSNSCQCVKNVSIDDKDLSISDNTLSLKRDDDPKTSNQSLIFGLIGLLIVVISGSMFLLYRFKLKTKKLKRHLQNVTVRYQSGSNDEFHNPMYAYATGANPTATYNNGSIATSYVPSSIQTTTLPHLPKTGHHNLNNISLTTPRKPNQNGYLNELSLLQNDVFAKKNALADETNPNLIMKKDQTFNSTQNNIYSTIEEIKKPDYKTEFEIDLKKEFSDNFDEAFKSDNLKNEALEIPEDNDSVDFEFKQITKRNEADAIDETKHQHYDRPKSSHSPPMQPVRYDQMNTVKSFSKLISKNDTEKETNEFKPDTSHYDILSQNQNHYDQVKN